MGLLRAWAGPVAVIKRPIQIKKLPMSPCGFKLSRTMRWESLDLMNQYHRYLFLAKPPYRNVAVPRIDRCPLIGPTISPRGVARAAPSSSPAESYHYALFSAPFWPSLTCEHATRASHQPPIIAQHSPITCWSIILSTVDSPKLGLLWLCLEIEPQTDGVSKVLTRWL